MLAACSSSDRAYRTEATAPPTRVVAVTETLHAITVVDNYRWLEGENAGPDAAAMVTPDIAAWTEAQNSYTRAVLDALPGRKALEDRLRPLMTIGTVTEPIVRGNRYFLARRAAGDDQATVYWREGFLGADRALVDPARFDPSAVTTVAWFSPSEDGKLLAFGTSSAPGQGTTLRLLEVDTGTPLPLEIANTPQGVQWLPDGSGFVYQQLKDAKDPSSLQGRFHRMGTPASSDPALSRAPFTRLSRDGRWLLLGYATGPASNDLWLANFEAVRRTGQLSPKPVSVGAPGQVAGAVVDGTLFLHTTQGAPNGRVVSVAAGDPGQPKWREIVAERSDAHIENVSFGRGLLAVTYRRNASNVVEVFDSAGVSRGVVSQPGIGVAGLTASEDRTEAYLTFTSFNYPPTVFRVDLANPGAAPRLWASPEAAIDPSSVEIEQVWYRSRDGARISMFLVHKKGLARAGDAPTVLAGYGSLGASMTPTFTATLFPWFDAGGVFAVPNLRGGGEYGDAWHRAAMLDRKQTAFDDALAAAEWLIANQYTNPAKLALYGGAHGGLTAAAAMIDRPDRFRAVLLLVPVLDMLRYHQFGLGPYWVPEYGSASDPAQAKWLASYSPYHRVKAGIKYPAVLLTAQEAGGPVHPMHARKMAAALQAATASDRAEQPILIRVDRDARLGPGAARAMQLRDLVDQRLFLMWQLGMLPR